MRCMKHACKFASEALKSRAQRELVIFSSDHLTHAVLQLYLDPPFSSLTFWPAIQGEIGPPGICLQVVTVLAGRQWCALVRCLVQSPLGGSLHCSSHGACAHACMHASVRMSSAAASPSLARSGACPVLAGFHGVLGQPSPDKATLCLAPVQHARGMRTRAKPRSAWSWCYMVSVELSALCTFAPVQCVCCLHSAYATGPGSARMSMWPPVVCS